MGELSQAQAEDVWSLGNGGQTMTTGEYNSMDAAYEIYIASNHLANDSSVAVPYIAASEAPADGSTAGWFDPNTYAAAQIVQLATGVGPSEAQQIGWVAAIEVGSDSLTDMANAFVNSTQFANNYNGGVAVSASATATSGTIVAEIIQGAHAGAGPGGLATSAQITAWTTNGDTYGQVFEAFAAGDQFSQVSVSHIHNYEVAGADAAVLGIGHYPTDSYFNH